MNKDRRLANLFFITFAILSLLMLVLPVNVFVRSARAVAAFIVLPSLKWSDSSARYLAGIPENVGRLLSTEQENRVLREQNRELELLKARLESESASLARLQESMAIASSWKWSGTWANVVERNRSRWYSTVLLDKGEQDGVQLHSPAVAVYKSTAGIAGKIIEVHKDTSRLLLCTDPMFSVTASVQDFDALAEGQGRLLMRLNYLSPELNITPGAQLRTSAASTVFPPSLPIGTVEKVYPAQNLTPFIYADVMPAVSPGALKEVFIITGRKARK